MQRCASLLLAAALLTSCATAATAPGLSAIEADFVCSLDDSFTYELRPRDDEQRLRALWRSADWTGFPQVARCSGQQRDLSRNTGSGFLRAIWVSRDGARAGVQFGQQRGALDGWGAACFYERRRGAWRQTGCIGTYVS